MIVIVAECSVTFWALSLSGVVSGLKTLETEHVKTLGENSVLLAYITAGAG